MAEFSFLNEKPYQNVVHDYKELTAKTVADKYIEFEFPLGNYVIESLRLVVKYDGSNIAPVIVTESTPTETSNSADSAESADLTNSAVHISIDDFIEEIVPYYDDRINSCILKPIPTDLLKVFATIGSQFPDRLCWEIPLLKMASFLFKWDSGDDQNYFCLKYGRTMHLRLVKSAKYNETLNSIFVFKHGTNLTNMPSDIMSCIMSATEKKMTYKITYRETTFVNGQGRICPPEYVVPYTLHKTELKIINSDTESVFITDEYNRFNYSYMLITLDVEPNVSIEKITLGTNLNPEFSSLMKLFSLSKELAEIYGLNYQLTDKFYLLDIGQYLNAEIKPFYDNKIESTRSPAALFDETTINLAQTQQSKPGSVLKPMEEIWKIDIAEKMTNLKLKLNLEFSAKTTGTARILLFN
jgi:hypothetical protein